MRLVRPTDFEILSILSDGKRNVAANIAKRIGKDRGYVNTRLPQLEDYGLIRKVGPAANTGLYEITPRGYTALNHRDDYDTTSDFETLLGSPTNEDRNKQ